MNRPIIYKLPMHPIFTMLEAVRKEGSELKKDIQEDPEGERESDVWIKNWEKILHAWTIKVQDDLNKIYRTPKQADEFGETYYRYQRVMDIGGSQYNRLMSQVTGRLKYLDKLLDEAYSYEQKGRESYTPITVPTRLLIPQPQTPSIHIDHIGDNVGRDKNTAKKIKVDNSSRGRKSFLWWLLGIVGLVAGGLLLAWLSGVLEL